MQFLLLFKADASSFDPSELELIFRSDPHFQDIRLNAPSGEPIDCVYRELDDWTLIHLDKDRDSIYFNSTQGAALSAVLTIQHALGVQMRVYNDSYTFDLTFSNIETVEELEAAMDNARTY